MMNHFRTRLFSKPRAQRGVASIEFAIVIACPRCGATTAPAPASAPVEADRKVLPVAPAPFAGTVGLRSKESKPAFPQPVKAPEGAKPPSKKQ